MANAMLATDDAKEYFGTSSLLGSDTASYTAFVEHIYASTLDKAGATVDAAGKAGWVEFLEAGNSRGEMVVKMIEAIYSYAPGEINYNPNDQATINAYNQFINRVAVSDYTADTLETITVSEINSTVSFSSALTVTADPKTVTTAKAAVAKAAEPVGSSIVLTTTQDNKNGTEGNDTFYAYASQNIYGATTNTLSTGDMIDGKDGSSDKIISSMINDETVNTTTNFAPMPIINNVEEIRVQALENGVNATSTNDVVILDADQITGETKYASDSSRADLVITNVDITSTQITNDIKLEMKDTQQNSDLAVYFDQTSLKANPDKVVSSAQVIIQVADGAQVTGTTAPLANMTFDLSFTQDGKTYSFQNIESTNGTYAGLVTAIQVALAAEGLTQYVVALSDTFSTFTTTAGKSVDLDYTANYVTITDSKGTAFSNITFAPEQKAGSEVAILLAQSKVNTDAVTTSDLIQSTITLDNVGRGSNGGEVIIGSTSASKSSTGVQKINVIVENSSVVHDISSTNNALKEITLKNGTVKGDFVLTNASYGVAANGGTYSNVKEADFTVGLKSITATDFDGDIVLGRDADIVNLGMLSAAVNGDVTYNATINDGATHTAVTGAGDDTYDITLNSAISKANTSDIIISTGNGTNTVTLTEGTNGTVATITGGNGVDTIHGENVAITVEAGAGNDVIYAENTGEKAVLKFATSAVTFLEPVPATDANGGNATIGQVEWLHGSQVQVTLTTAGTTADANDTGFESALIEIVGSSANGYLTTKADINTAILKAINEDATLSKLATATVDAAGDVVVTYKVDGAQAALAAGLNVSFYAPKTPLSTTVTNAAIAAWEKKYKDSAEFPATTADYATAQGLAIIAANGVTKSFVTATEAAKFTVTGSVANGDTVTVTAGVGTFTYTAAGGDGATAAGVATAIAALHASLTVDTDGVTVLYAGAANSYETDLTISGTSASSVGSVTVTTQGSTGVGTDATNSGANSVNGGAGDDVIVLSSDAAATDTVVLTGYNQGTDTIVHFDTNVDKLDLSAYLINTINDNAGSTSEDSQVQFDSVITVAGTAALTANSVTVMGITNAAFNGLLDTAAGTTSEFDTLTAAKVEAALEDATSLFSTTVSAKPLYGTQKAISILIIENNEINTTNAATSPLLEAKNLGEYMIFEVTYNDVGKLAGAVDKDFTVKLIGTLDMEDTGSLAATDILS